MKSINRLTLNLLIFLGSLIIYHDLSTADPNNESDNYHFSQSTYGPVGLIQNPTATFDKDGELIFGISSDQPYNRLYGKVQFFPWLEAVLKYTEGENKTYNRGLTQTWKDKGIDLKIRLLEEREYIPALAVGIYDVGGTGSFSSEFITSSSGTEKGGPLKSLELYSIVRSKAFVL